MNVDDYFEVYTGGNDYIKTWTPKALKEFAEDYHKQKLREGENGLLPQVSCSLLPRKKYYWPNPEMANGSGNCTHSSKLIALSIKTLGNIIQDCFQEPEQ